MPWDIDASRRYVSNLKCKKKRAFAEQYRAWLIYCEAAGERHLAPDYRAANISEQKAQQVRKRLAELLTLD